MRDDRIKSSGASISLISLAVFTLPFAIVLQSAYYCLSGNFPQFLLNLIYDYLACYALTILAFMIARSEISLKNVYQKIKLASFDLSLTMCKLCRLFKVL